LLFGLSAKSKKKITLRALCDFAVNYYQKGKQYEREPYYADRYGINGNLGKGHMSAWRHLLTDPRQSFTRPAMHTMRRKSSLSAQVELWQVT